MSGLIQQAESYVAYEMQIFAIGKSPDYFHPMNRDEWVASFCEWLADKQRKSAEVRASND